MSRVWCPECDRSGKVPAGRRRPFVRCDSCGRKIPLDEDEGAMVSLRNQPPPSSVAGGCFLLRGYAAALLGIVICVVVGFVFHPVVAILVGTPLGILIGVAA